MVQLFELGGESLDAFNNLSMLKVIKMNRALEGDGTQEHAQWRSEFDQAVIEGLKTRYKDFQDGVDMDAFVAEKMEACLTQLGQNSPVITVLEFADGCCYPRAYESFPEIWLEQYLVGVPPEEAVEGEEYKVIEGKQYREVTGYYMRSPVGYDGSSFTPAGAAPVDQNKREQLEGLWFNPWGGGMPILHKYGRGVAIPDDFKPSEKPTWLGQSVNSGACFRVHGPAMGILERYFQARGADDAVFQKLKEVMLEGQGEGTHLGMSRDNRGFSFTMHGPDGKNMKSFECPHVVIEPTERDGSFRVLAGNCDTEKGRELQALLDTALDKMPDLKTFESGVLSVHGVANIRHEEFAGAHYLVYYYGDRPVPSRIDTIEGLERVDIRERNWLAETQNDLTTRIPPPPPAPLACLEPVLDRMAGQTKRPDYIANDGLVFVI